ncbi:MAG TPA: DUF2339 domain-containing protein [Pyrinomonadaceae bacterium]|nr:DUF2339 domain-containing protein [Pyrinomonadaceae bacterium]
MAEDDPAKDSSERLIARLDALEDLLRMHTARLHAIEQWLGIDFNPPKPAQRKPLYEQFSDEREWAAPDAPRAQTPTDAPHTPRATPPPPPPPTPSPKPPPTRHTPPPTSTPPPSTPAGEQTARESAARPDEARRTEPPRTETRRDVESLVGGSWFNWIGIIAITFGVAFFLKYAFDNQWVGPGARVALGGAGGLAILLAADRLRARGLRSYAYVIAGGGILILYLSVYAAFGFYRLTSQPVAFLLMSAVTAGAVALSVRHNALAIAVLGLVGGFVTPVLLSTGTDNQLALFTYIALLDAGVLALAYFKAWRVLNYAVFLLTLVMIAGWADRHYAVEKLWPTVFFLTLFFLLFSALGVVYNVLRQRPARWYDVLLLIVNATFYFGLCYKWLEEAGYTFALGSFALLVSAFFVLLYYAAWARHRADLLLAYSYLGAAATFAAIAVAVQLDLHWVTIGWAVEGLMLTWVGLRARASAPRHAAVLVFAAALAHWFGWDMSGLAQTAGETFVPLLNRRALSCAALVAALAASARLYARATEETVEAEEASALGTFFVLAGVLVAFTLLTLDTNDYFGAQLARLAPEETLRRNWLENVRQMSLTGLWATYGAGVLALGVARRMVLLRFASALLLAATALKVLAIDAFYYDAPYHLPVFNQTFLAFAWVVAALAFAAWLYARARDVGERERALARPALLLAANLLALTALSLEAVGLFRRGGAPVGGWTPRENNIALALSVVWTLYAVGAHAYGLRRRVLALRYGALALLTVTAVKLLLWDAGYYDAPWHTLVFNQTFAAFALFVAALWFVVHSYARAGEVDEEERRAVPVLTTAAHAMAVIALSAEAGGYFAKRFGAQGVAPEELRDLRLARGLALSVVWAVYGGALLLYGYLRRAKLQRLLGLALLGLVTLKVFFYDLSSLDRIYRIISFIVLGVVLLAVSYLYQQKRRGADEPDADASDTEGDDAKSVGTDAGVIE